MKKIKKMAPLLLVLLYIVTAAYMLNNKIDAIRQYNTLVSQAREYVKNGVIVDAMEAYEQALTLKPSADLCIEAGEVYIDSKDYYSAKRWYLNQLLSQYPSDARTYEYGIRVYMAQQKYEEVFNCYDKYQAKNLNSESVEQIMEDILYQYSIVGQYDDVSVFSNATDTAAVKSGELWGYVDASGNRTINYSYLEADIFSSYAAVLGQDKTPYYIDTSGNKKITVSQIMEANPDLGEVTALNGIESDLILAFGADGWYYCDSSSLQKKFGSFQDATKITNGIGAVSNASGKWALIDAQDNLQTDYLFDSVVSDAKGIVCRTDAIIVCKDGQYILVDHTGTQIGTNSYSEAKAFNDSTYAAMKRDNQWYFVDEKGQELSLGSFDEVESFSNGLAAVKINGLWGYITVDGTSAIDCQFTAAGPFSQSGSAFVQRENESWGLLLLYRYHH